MTIYRVLVDDNFHYMDKSERYELGTYDLYDEALVAAKRIVDDFLLSNAASQNSAKELMDHYIACEDDPFITPSNGKQSF